MNTKAASYLRGFYSFERSFNLRVLVDDKEIKTAYEEAKIKGRLPFNRSKILILGDHAAGKTSTCRRLQGKDFRKDESSTEGIETNTVKAKVSDVNSKWCEVSNTPLEDYESSAAWWAVSHVRKTTKSGMSKTDEKHWTIVEDVIYQGFQLLPILFIFMIRGLTFGFGVVAWVYIISLMSLFDVHTAYRFGSGYAIAMVIVDGATYLTDFDQDLQGIKLDELVNIIITMMLYGVFSIITGFMIGGGGRTGVCVALCFMVHPLQEELPYKNLTTERFIKIVQNASLEVWLSVIGFFSVVIFRYVHFKYLQLSWMNRVFVTLIVIFKVALGMLYMEAYSLRLLMYFITVVSIILMCAGNLIGRKCSAYWYIPESYIIKKTIGFIFGICMARIVGWEFIDLGVLNLADHQQTSIQPHLFSALLFIVPLILFIVYECSAYLKVRHTLSVPLKHICQSMKANIREESYLDARLSLWDFAGQDMYYNTHHLFMPKQGVYLVVFNAVEAVINPAKQLKRLHFWLQSIAMHAEVENVVVLLIGTRRESVRDMNALSDFSRLAKAHLYKRFSKLITFHPIGSIFFYVENALSTDKEINTIREVIYNEIKNMTYFQTYFSVKYLLFNETLNRFRQQISFITRLDIIFEEAKSTCNIMTEDELRQFLNFFDRSGDIIYKEGDEMLRNYVICEPQRLVDILQHLVNVPEPHNRNRAVADYWQRLQDTGIVDSRLLEHICREQGIWRLYPYVIRFLVGTNLLFPLFITDEIDQVGIFCLSCRLPKITMMSTIWNSKDKSQDIFYFDFGEIPTELIFLRLIAKCCKEFNFDNIYYNAARFRTSKLCLFVINMQVIVGAWNSYDRNLIKVSILNEDEAQVINVLQKMITFTEEIIDRDFNPKYFKENYIFGPVCERCSSFDDTMCLVNIITHGNDANMFDCYRPDHYHRVSFEPKLNLTCSR
ncbi:uncharacterized protein LOC117117237 isoform X2 [Anneissia japonica]|uniref:uncharacterized protein LOC117117237 isoform X2 n=1 Tax=Anneissia japonica TaxID=1529436 RepID=UPI00142570FA|nr:uncharacterized protein LOC117117237 isoform X2 [Anneissia japonica]